MAGLMTTIENIRKEIAQLATRSRVRFSDVQKQIDALEGRLDKLTTPANTQTGKKARRAASGSARRSPSVPGEGTPSPQKPDALI